MRSFLLSLTISFFVGQLNAQSAEDSVKAAVNKLFTGMKTADPAMVRTSFADAAILQTIASDKEGKVIIKTEPVSEFADFIATVKKDSADERIQFETIKIDGPLSIVWTPYNFYFNGKFSHCGVNSFQLVRLEGIWKIQYIIDTRRRSGCELTKPK